MQVLWSRTAQTRFYGCKPCLHSATTLTRRTTTAASKRRLKASDVFTVCYSAMFATAALLDAKIKDDRRRQWDQAIAEAKATNNVTKTESSSTVLEDVAYQVNLGDEESQNLIGSTTYSVFGPHGQATRLSPIMTTQGELSLDFMLKSHERPLETQLRILDSHIREASIRGEISNTRNMHDVTRANVEDHPSCRRRPEMQIHYENVQQIVWKLVARLLLNTKHLAKNEAAEAVCPPEDLNLQFDMMADRVASLEKGLTGFAAYVSLDSKATEERRALNEAISVILTTPASTSANVDLMVAKICYNLLISTASPSVETYKMMLIHFTRLEQHHLAQAVVDTFIENTALRPTSGTVAAILNHYIAKGDGDGFRSTIQRMHSVEGDVIRENDFLPEVPWNGLVFESLILGSLRFFQMSRAVMYFKAALRKGHATANIFLQISQVCLDERNRKAARNLLSAIVSQWHQRDGFLELECYAEVRKMIFRLLGLCGIEKSITASNYQQFAYVHQDFHVFKTWLRSIRLELIKRKIIRSAEVISGLEIMVVKYSSKESTPEIVESHVVNLTDECHPVGQPWEEPLALLAAAHVALRESSLKAMKRQLFDIIYECLPSDCKEIYHGLVNHSPHMPWTKKLEAVLLLRLTKPEIVQRGDVVIRYRRMGDSAPSANSTSQILGIDRQVPKSTCASKINVGCDLLPPLNFDVGDREWCPPPGTSKWLVTLDPYKLETSLSHSRSHFTTLDHNF